MSYRRPLEAARQFLSACVELVWCSGFLIAGLSRKRPVPRWSSPGRQRVLVIAPHPDDESIACAGTISNHVRAGDRVVIAIATDGRLARQAQSQDQMASIRQQEAERAAQCLGVERLEWLGLHEGSWTPADLSRRLAALLEEHAVTVVYAPSRIDFHPEHVAVAGAFADALRSVIARNGETPQVRIYQVQVPLTSILTNLVAETSAALGESDRALSAYRSQAGSIAFLRRVRRYSTRLYRAPGSVELFWALTADQYVSLHGESSSEPRARFRGLRRFAWTDPLAYLVGSRERRRLRALAARAATAQEARS